MKKFKYILLTFLALFIFLPAQAVFAQSDNALCWTTEQCAEGFRASAERMGVTATYNEDIHFEPRPNSCPLNQGYCFPPSRASKLSVPILGVSEVNNLGGYTQVVLNYLIILTSLASVIMISVAGLMWMTARGNATKAGNAKPLIGKSIFTILVLLFSVTLLQFIDPSLIRLNPLRTPMIKTVDFVADGASCEYLLRTYGEQGLKIKTSTGKECGFNDRASCGSCGGAEGEVVDLGELETSTNIFTGLEIGTKCNFGRCTDPGAKCVRPNPDTAYSCQRCGTVLDSEDFQTMTVDASSCALFSKQTDEGSNVYCEFIESSWIEAIAEQKNLARTNFCVEIVYPQGQDNFAIDCDRLAAANANKENDGKNCSAYDLLAINSTETWTGVGTWSRKLSDLARSNDSAKDTFANYCQSNICNWEGLNCLVTSETSNLKNKLQLTVSGALGPSTMLHAYLIGVYQTKNLSLNENFVSCVPRELAE